MPQVSSERRALLREKYREEIETFRDATLQMIMMEIGQQVFALDIMKTREIISTPAISKLPFTEDYVLGIFQFRGKTVLAVDLGKKIGLEPADVESETFTVIVESDGYQLGFVLEKMPATIRLSGSAVQEINEILTDTTRHETYIKGIAEQNDTAIYLMDVEEFIADTRVKLDDINS